MRAGAPPDDTAELRFVAVDEVFDVTPCVVDAVRGTIGVPEMVGSPIRLTDDGIPVKYRLS